MKVGSGPRPLVVLPGFGDAMFGGSYTPGTGWLLTPYFGRYRSDHTVYLPSRPRGLPADYDAEEAAESHARVVESILEERDESTERRGRSPLRPGDAAENTAADVIGISMGRLIAQELARRRPDLVHRLVLANSAYKLADEARPQVRRFEKYAREGDWQSIRAELASAMYSDVRAIAYPPLIRTVGRMALPTPPNPLTSGDRSSSS